MTTLVTGLVEPVDISVDKRQGNLYYSTGCASTDYSTGCHNIYMSNIDGGDLSTFALTSERLTPEQVLAQLEAADDKYGKWGLADAMEAWGMPQPRAGMKVGELARAVKFCS